MPVLERMLDSPKLYQFRLGSPRLPGSPAPMPFPEAALTLPFGVVITGPGCGAGTRKDPMQVVILCGGQGTRIRDVHEDLPKPMLPIGGRPILWHIMKSYAHYGYRDFILCL